MNGNSTGGRRQETGVRIQESERRLRHDDFGRERRFQPPTIAQRTRKHAVPALTSEATCGNLKRKFGEFRAQRIRKHANKPSANEFAAPS